MTPKQEQFCREYLVDLNATQAAIRAGYSEKTANREGSRLLSKADIQAKVSELTTKRSERVGRDADEVVRRLWAIVEADLRKAFEPDGTPKRISDLPDDIAAALAGVKIGDTLDLKLNDRLKALDMIGKHLGMFTEKVEMTTQAQVQITLPHNGRDNPKAIDD